MAVEFVDRGQRDQAEAARVVEDDGVARVGAKDDVVVARRRGRRIAVDDHAARHAEVNEHHRAVVEMHQDVFGASRDLGDAAAGQALGETLGQGDAQLLGALFDGGETTADEVRRKAAAHGFDFGQFGHGGRD